MKRTLLLLSVMLSTMMASAQISHEVFGMVLGSEEQKVFDAWNEAGVKYEYDNTMTGFKFVFWRSQGHKNVQDRKRSIRIFLLLFIIICKIIMDIIKCP